MSTHRFTTTRGVQIGLLVLLSICAAQIGWWIFDEIRYTRDVHDRWQSLDVADAEQAELMLTHGVPPSVVQERFPDLRIADQVTIRDEVGLRRDRELASRINRFAWEGGFFLATLVLGMVILSRALRQQARLRQREQDFLAAVSHELKSPLASIRLAAETLAHRQPDPERATRQVRRILEDVGRLECMITNILHTSRMDSGEAVSPTTGSVDLHVVLDGLLEEMQPWLEERRVRVRHGLGQEEFRVRTDGESARTVLLNLVDNAVKALGREGGEIEVSAARENGQVVLCVRDDGVGFPASESRRLFEKFYRLGDEMRRTTTGSGLGLYLVRRLVENAGGQVGATSAGPGQGAEFRVSWPSEPPGDRP